MRWLVDGYNLLRGVSCFANLELQNPTKAKQDLLNFLEAFHRATGEKVQVYFDRYSQTGNVPLQEEHGGISVFYSRGGYTADEEIMLQMREQGEQALVVTSDREIQRAAKASRCSYLEAREFYEGVMEILHQSTDDEDVINSRLKGNAFRPREEKRKAFNRLKKFLQY
ncbi:MAG: NYN domain-containing protein [Deltaproteobacteria bacterium]|nr:NYN domain-containing protein [Deltaproteobacteria bacterium]